MSSEGVYTPPSRRGSGNGSGGDNSQGGHELVVQQGRRCAKEGEPQLLVAEAKPRLTCAEWEAKVAEEKRSSEDSGSSGEKTKYRGKFDKSKIDCRNCGEFGHFADECPAVKKVVKDVAQLTMVHADDEPALL
ncbi:hypothetical protein E2562_004446 [Oryza meyeriana var. granulata]|uniref:CCHC-type domain-containing protein n=1 Tax=Oryza meyeriana var. granulata TaxID=110450 RepID=A0A6G1CZB6_9ORYZ|nr:hypothetical protein E2562_004446 [Oryza meyeriana var. granulata]